MSVSRIMQRGAQYIALERGLAQSRAAKPTFVPYDRSRLPVAGEIVEVHGLPVTKTGRIIPDNPAAELERNTYIDTLAMEIDRQLAEHRKTIKEVPNPPRFRPKDKIYQAVEPNLSMHAYRKPGIRRVFKNDKPQRWSQDGHDW